MAPPAPPSLCSACGRDLPEGLGICGCRGLSEPWEGGERTGLFGRRWRTASGAEAFTHLGWLARAGGRGRASFPQLVAPHYGALRGDVVAGLRESVALRDPPVDALLAALVGGAAREAIALRGVRTITWSRRGARLRVLSGHRGFDDVSVERGKGRAADEDRLLQALLAPRGSAYDLSVSVYRGEPAVPAPFDSPSGPTSVVGLIARAVPADDLLESWVFRQSAAQIAPSVGDRACALLAEALRDESHRALIEELTRHLRFAVRPALASRGGAG